MAAGAGALACSMARMVAVYSIDPSGDDEASALPEQLERADLLLRQLADEDAVAYQTLSDATKKLKSDPSAKDDYELAVNVAAAVPMEIATVASRSLDLIAKLVPVGRKYMLTDLGVAAVVAEATVRAAGYIVRANTVIMSDADARKHSEHAIDELIARSSAKLVDIEAALSARS